MRATSLALALGLSLIAAACATDDDGEGPAAGGDGGAPDARRPTADAPPVTDSVDLDGGIPLPDGFFFAEDGGFHVCETDDDCEEGTCCASLPLIKVCVEKEEDAGPGECSLAMPPGWP